MQNSWQFCFVYTHAHAHTHTHNTRINTPHNKTTALSLSAYHFLLLSTRLLPPSAYSIVLHALVDSSCRASTFHIITTSDVCGPEARWLAEPAPSLEAIAGQWRACFGERGEAYGKLKGELPLLGDPVNVRVHVDAHTQLSVNGTSSNIHFTSEVTFVF